MRLLRFIGQSNWLLLAWLAWVHILSIKTAGILEGLYLLFFAFWFIPVRWTHENESEQVLLMLRRQRYVTQTLLLGIMIGGFVSRPDRQVLLVVLYTFLSFCLVTRIVVGLRGEQK